MVQYTDSAKGGVRFASKSCESGLERDLKRSDMLRICVIIDSGMFHETSGEWK